jgi:hypothetical protein
MTDRHDYECRNCATKFEGSFCPNCGQSTTEYDRPFLFLISDLASGVFSFDARLWKSLVVLLLRPGRMEVDYTDGRRARYVPPFRLYLFVSFFFFLLLTTITNRMLEENRSYFSSLSIGEKDGDAFIRMPGSDEAEENRQQTFPDLSAGIEPTELPQDTSESRVSVSFDNSDEAKVRDILSNPEKYAGRFFRYFTWSLFLLMPLYGSLLWMFFRGTRPYYLPHFLLSMNQHLIAFVMFSVMLLPQLLWPLREMGWEGYLNLAIPVYHYLGAKRLYARGWRATLIRLLGAQILYSLALLLAMTVVAYFALV